MLHTLHGLIKFDLQRFVDSEGNRCTYFDFGGDFSKSYISDNLQEHSLWLSLNSSYEQVEKILDRQIPDRVMSSGKIQQLVVEKAMQISEAQRRQVLETQSLPVPHICTDFDLYDPNNGEVEVFEDGILVKGQKDARRSKKMPFLAAKTKKERTFQSMDMAVLPNAAGKKERLIGGIGKDPVPLAKAMAAHMKTNFSTTGIPIRIVTITDGATSIKLHMEEVFGIGVRRILDWYHLKKKVNEMCILICTSKEARQEVVKKILQHCWIGDVEAAIQYLATEVKSRNGAAFEKFQKYLSKHSPEIINYEKRKKNGLTIGSGEIESTVKQTVASRQKTKGMSWSEQGCKALAILKTQFLNEKWGETWYCT